MSPRVKHPRRWSPDRHLHAFVRFAPYPSQTEGLTGTARGGRMRAFLQRMFAAHAEAFAHGTAEPNAPLTELLRGESRTFLDAPLLERTNLYGHGPLHLATMLGDHEAVEALLARGANVMALDHWHNTPLHWARLVGDDALAERLLRAGASPDARNAFGGTPLDYARLLGDVDAHTLEASNVWVKEGASFAQWDADRVAAEVGFRPWLRSLADNDFVFDMFLRSRGNAVRRAELRLIEDPGPPAPIALAYYGGALGWGVVAMEDIPRGAYVGDYGGRIAHFVARHDSDNAYSCTLGEYRRWVQVVVRARREGTLLSRANSSTGDDDANMSIRMGWYRGEPRLVLTARKSIRAGEQLLWNYGEGYWEGRGSGPQSAS